MGEGRAAHRAGLIALIVSGPRAVIIQSESIEHLGLNYSSTSTYFQGAKSDAWMSSGVRMRAAGGRVAARGAETHPVSEHERLTQPSDPAHYRLKWASQR